MQIRNAIPWIRLGPINVQNITVGDLYANYEGDPLNVISSSTKKLYQVSGGKTDTHLKNYEKWKRDFPEGIFYLKEWQKLYSMAFLASRETKIQSLQFKIIHRMVPCRLLLLFKKC